MSLNIDQWEDITIPECDNKPCYQPADYKFKPIYTGEYKFLCIHCLKRLSKK